jgi:hypothetical protein
VQNLRRGHYKLSADVPAHDRLGIALHRARTLPLTADPAPHPAIDCNPINQRSAVESGLFARPGRARPEGPSPRADRLRSRVTLEDPHRDGGGGEVLCSETDESCDGQLILRTSWRKAASMSWPIAPLIASLPIAPLARWRWTLPLCAAAAMLSTISLSARSSQRASSSALVWSSEPTDVTC